MRSCCRRSSGSSRPSSPLQARRPARKTGLSTPSFDTDNPYLRHYEQVVEQIVPTVSHRDPLIGANLRLRLKAQRDALVGTYAWAVPNEVALSTVAKHSPIVEIGAGTGYWASLLQARGVDIKPYDHCPPDQGANAYHDDKVWTRVYRGGPRKAAAHPDRALLLCWPPFGASMAHDALAHYAGNTVIYVGEWSGCTGSEAFHKRLRNDFQRVESVEIPVWPDCEDTLSVWKRKHTG